jgi:16S rRNA (cytidine1402-2'-O)-methyltransferase
VREAIAQDVHVEAIPGASALLTALVLAGLPSDRFLFAGFLPPRSGERRNALVELKSIPASLVFFESPNRLGECLADMADMLGVRSAAVGRELTKLHEEIRRGTLAELASGYADEDTPRGEVTIVVGPPPDEALDTARMDSLLRQALAFMPVRAAADLVAEALDAPRKPVYARALELKAEADV